MWVLTWQVDFSLSVHADVSGAAVLVGLALLAHAGVVLLLHVVLGLVHQGGKLWDKGQFQTQYCLFACRDICERIAKEREIYAFVCIVVLAGGIDGTFNELTLGADWRPSPIWEKKTRAEAKLFENLFLCFLFSLVLSQWASADFPKFQVGVIRVDHAMHFHSELNCVLL